ncbi:hypothetical protein [Micromonospora sp. MH99]|uniref:hypothetical protein n=1 Tax=Micromonospora sp. MH99 TaxID=1945510 RepID=UPI001F30765D|nr:hypothetical protein [Micromonospora sp. MH99]
MQFDVVVQTLIGAVVGGTLVPYLTHAREKRTARSAVRQQLSDLEQKRWAASKDDAAEKEFERAAERFEAEAISSGLPRSVVELYVQLARVSFYTTQETFGEYHVVGADGPVVGGSLHGDTATVVEAARDLVVDSIWRPAYSSVTRGRRIRAVRATVKAVIDSEDGETVWDTWHEENFPRNVQMRNIRKRRDGHRKSSARLHSTRPPGQRAVSDERQEPRPGQDRA